MLDPWHAFKDLSAQPTDVIYWGKKTFNNLAQVLKAVFVTNRFDIQLRTAWENIRQDEQVVLIIYFKTN